MMNKKQPKKQKKKDEKADILQEKESKKQQQENDIKTKSPPPKTPEQLAEEYKAGWQRALADYKNLENQVAKEKVEFVKYAKQAFIESLIPTLDYFETALKHQPDLTEAPETAQKSYENWLLGIVQVQKLLLETLKNEGVEEILMTGEFNPNLHEAVEERESPDGKSGDILEIKAKGYMLNGKLIRPAKVIIKK